jgi:ferredoxin-NADP reductase
VIEEAPGVTSIEIGGRRLERLRARSGQFFTWRFLTRDRWWEAHPFSLSAAPDGKRLRITVKGVGEYTSSLRALRPGTRGAELHYVIGDHREGELLSPAHLQRLVPDIADRDVYVCGPPAMTDATRATLDRSGVARGHIVTERFAF